MVIDVKKALISGALKPEDGNNHAQASEERKGVRELLEVEEAALRNEAVDKGVGGRLCRKAGDVGPAPLEGGTDIFRDDDVRGPGRGWAPNGHNAR